MTIAWIRFLLGGSCLLAGLFFIISSVIGNYRFKFALNRMHAAALGDTLGLLGVILGLCFLNGLNATTLKLLAVVGLVWMTSPVSGHLIMLMEISNGRHITESQESTDEQGLETYSVDIKRSAMDRFDSKHGKGENKS